MKPTPAPGAEAIYFDHERLEVYRSAIQFVRWAQPHLKSLPTSVAARGQLDRARTSIPLNIAEGNGKWTAADKCRFFDIAHGSALECAAILDVLHASESLDDHAVKEGKDILVRVVSLLVGLIKSKQPLRLGEEPAEYAATPVEPEE